MYKSMVQAATQDLAAVRGSPSSPYLPPSESVSNSSSPQAPGPVPSTSREPSTDNSSRWSALYGDLAGAIQRLVEVVMQIRGWESHDLIGIAEDALRCVDVRARIDRWLGSVFYPRLDDRAPRRHDLRIVNSGRRIDGVPLREWRAVPASVKALLFNVVMAAGGFSPSALASRTVFIPKKIDSPTPADFRPISISSVVVRHLHKILAERIRDARVVDFRQRCFDDGCAENISVLAAVMSEARTQRRELHVASLDIAKAFDSVSHGAVDAALIRLGVDAVLDGMPPDVGFKLGDSRVSCLTYADDILLFATTKWGLQTALSAVEDKAREQRLRFNAGKCAVLSMINTAAEWRYLGVRFKPVGPKKVDGDLFDLLDNLTRAPLKPQQRLMALRGVLLPRVFHALVLGRVTLGKLRALDRQTRAAVRRWLQLPHDTASGFFHASTRDGGLGILSLATTVPGLMLERFERLGRSLSSAVRAAADSQWVSNRIRWACNALTVDGDCLSTTYRH
ncbi:hypothetical protein KPH14_000857 [Odynerus spinipes]|uniref:Reverse transcriptase domain-containing protein n=1 Tax=Odynerus spinipes TaxID=1348599 RepID=A0AAD9RDX3_9HYME|nr:hypothetical protein KPH14_000857 [Odynerus spinipes]